MTIGKTLVVVLLMLAAVRPTALLAQTTEFAYQGRLQEGGNAANGNFDFEFLLFDSSSGGTQQGSTLTLNTVAVSAGIFSVKLDFGSQFPGANRFLEVRVRPAGGGAYASLAPRQALNSAPYAIQSLNAATAVNATQLGGIAAGQYVLTTDSRMTNSRPPTAGSNSYIQNGTSTQTASDFNISGNGTAGGTLSGNVVNTATEFNIGGSRFASNAGGNNTFVGIGAGSVASGFRNAFFGTGAGQRQTSGNFNAFFGPFAGTFQTSGTGNAYFGDGAGFFAETGQNNAYFGSGAGANNRTGTDNSYFGQDAGNGGFSDSNNSAFGKGAGASPSGGNFNSFFGAFTGNPGFPVVNSGTAIGARAYVTQSNSIVLGGINGINGATADTNVGIGTTAPGERLHVVGNGLFTGNLNVNGLINGTFSGSITNALNLGGVPADHFVQTNDARLADARSPLAGSSNYIQNGTSPQAASFNVTGSGTVNGTLSGGIVDAGAQYNLGGTRVLKTTAFDVFLGVNAGASNTTGGGNTFVGGPAGSSNTAGIRNSFFGSGAGEFNSTGSNNAYFGYKSGQQSVGNSNTFLGSQSGSTQQITATDTTLVGFSAGTSNVSTTNATAIGARAAVTQSNSLVLGSINSVNGATADTNVGIGTTAPASRLHVNGNIRVTGGGIFVSNPNTLVITSPNGACWGITVNDFGALSTFPTSCP